MSVLSKRHSKFPNLELKSPETASTVESSTLITHPNPISALNKSPNNIRSATSNAANRAYFFTTSVFTDHDEELPVNSNELSSTLGFSTVRELTVRNGLNNPKKSQALSKLGTSLPTMKLAIKNLNSTDTKSPPESDRRLMTAQDYTLSERSDFEYKKQEKYIKKNPHFFKFSSYVQALSKTESKNSLFNKETFYYPDQIEINQKLEEKVKQMQKLEMSSLYLTRTLREGKKEMIDLPIGTRCYLNLDCVGRKFPLKVKILVMAGIFEVYVSKSIEKPNKQNCDYSFNISSFEIPYGEHTEIQNLYFCINGVGKLKIAIIVNFLSMHQEKKTEPPKRPVMKHKTVFPSNVYEFCKECMSQEEKAEFKNIIMQLKKEKNAKNGRNIIKVNQNIAADYQNVKQIRQIESAKGRDFRIQRARETKDVYMEHKKKSIMANLIRPDIRKLENNWKNEEEHKIRHTIALQKSWFGLIALTLLGRNILEKKRAGIALRILKTIKESHAVRIQRKVRAYFSKPLVVKGEEMGATLESDIFHQKEAWTAVNLYKALNSTACLLKQAQSEKAARLMTKFLSDSMETFNIRHSFNNYIDKICKIQGRWKQNLEIIKARVHIFTICWQDYCHSLVADPKLKKKLSEFAPKIRREHVVKHAKDFIYTKTRSSLKEQPNLNAILLSPKSKIEASYPSESSPSVQEKDFVLQDKADLSPNNKGDLSPSGSDYASSRGEGFETALQKRFRYKPTNEELQEAFENIVKYIQKEEFL